MLISRGARAVRFGAFDDEEVTAGAADDADADADADAGGGGGAGGGRCIGMCMLEEEGGRDGLVTLCIVLAISFESASN